MFKENAMPPTSQYRVDPTLDKALNDMALQDMLRGDTVALDDEFGAILSMLKGKEELRPIRTQLELLRYRVSKHLINLSVLQVQLRAAEAENRRLRVDAGKKIRLVK
jgi:hypothetical protein